MKPGISRFCLIYYFARPLTITQAAANRIPKSIPTIFNRAVHEAAETSLFLKKDTVVSTLPRKFIRRCCMSGVPVPSLLQSRSFCTLRMRKQILHSSLHAPSGPSQRLHVPFELVESHIV